MFYITKLSSNIKISSSQIESNIINNIESELRKNYESAILGHINGFIIAIHKIKTNNITKGILNDMSGSVNYEIDYYASIFVPKNKKILDI